MSKTVSLGFIQSDVNTQLRASRELLEAVRTLRSAIEKVAPDTEAYKEIEHVIQKLVRLTQDLVQNATNTGKTVADILGAA